MKVIVLHSHEDDFVNKIQFQFGSFNMVRSEEIAFNLREIYS